MRVLQSFDTLKHVVIHVQSPLKYTLFWIYFPILPVRARIMVNKLENTHVYTSIDYLQNYVDEQTCTIIASCHQVNERRIIQNMNT